MMIWSFGCTFSAVSCLITGQYWWALFAFGLYFVPDVFSALRRAAKLALAAATGTAKTPKAVECEGQKND